MKITVPEMSGLLKGLCLPADIRTGEYLPEYLVRKFDELQQKLDAMGHECGKMLGLLNDICRYHEECTHDDMMHALIPLEYVSAINTFVARDVDGENPFAAIDAYLNSVRADAVSNLWNKSLRDVAHVLNDIRAFDDSSEAAGIVHSEIKERVDDFVENLRSGTHDTADKAG